MPPKKRKAIDDDERKGSDDDAISPKRRCVFIDDEASVEKSNHDSDIDGPEPDDEPNQSDIDFINDSDEVPDSLPSPKPPRLEDTDEDKKEEAEDFPAPRPLPDLDSKHSNEELDRKVDLDSESPVRPFTLAEEPEEPIKMAEEEKTGSKFPLPNFLQNQRTLVPSIEFSLYASDLDKKQLESELDLLVDYFLLRDTGRTASLDQLFEVLKVAFPEDVNTPYTDIVSIGDNLMFRIEKLKEQIQRVSGNNELEEIVLSRQTEKVLRMARKLCQMRQQMALIPIEQDDQFCSLYSMDAGILDDVEVKDLTPFQKAVILIKKYFAARHFRHIGSTLYEPDLKGGIFRYYFTRCNNDIRQEISNLSNRGGGLTSEWRTLTAAPNMIDQVKAHFENSTGDMFFPELKVNRVCFRLENGVFFASDCLFKPFHEVKEDLVCVNKFDVPWPDFMDDLILNSSFFRYGVDPRSQKRGSAEHQKLFVEDKSDWFDSFRRHCPNFWKIVDYQFQEMPSVEPIEKWQYFDSEVLKRFFVALYGRAIFPLRARDNMHRVFTGLGHGGSGKGDLAECHRGILGAHNVCQIANSMEKTFGLSGLEGHLMWQIRELRSGFRMDISDWLSLVIGECIMMRAKFKTPYSYTSSAGGTQWGNEWPDNFKNKLNSVTRRLFLFWFHRPVDARVNDPELSHKIVAEYPYILIFISIAYRSLLTFMAKNKVKDIRRIWHYSLDENLKQLDRQQDPLVAFLQSPYLHVHQEKDKECKKVPDEKKRRDQRCCIGLSDFQQAFAKFCETRGFNQKVTEIQMEAVFRGYNIRLTKENTFLVDERNNRDRLILGVSLSNRIHVPEQKPESYVPGQKPDEKEEVTYICKMPPGPSYLTDEGVDNGDDSVLMTEQEAKAILQKEDYFKQWENENMAIPEPLFMKPGLGFDKWPARAALFFKDQKDGVKICREQSRAAIAHFLDWFRDVLYWRRYDIQNLAKQTRPVAFNKWKQAVNRYHLFLSVLAKADS